MLRGRLTDLGHPEPDGEGAAVGPDSSTGLGLRRALAGGPTLLAWGQRDMTSSPSMNPRPVK